MSVTINNMCRGCMSIKSDCSKNTVTEFTKMSEKTIEMFTFCTSIKVLEDDGLPLDVCSRCLDNIQTCYHFINICKSTNEALRHIQLNDIEMVIKEEIEEKKVINYLPDANSDKCNIEISTNMSDCINSDVNMSDGEYSEKLVDVKTELLTEANSVHEKEINGKVLRIKIEKIKNEKQKKKKKKDVLYKVKGRRKNSYRCSKCSEVITGLAAFNQHKRDVHPERKIYSCDICNQTFERYRSMLSHLKVHNIRHKCKLCSDNFKYKCQLKSHVIMCHTTEKPFKCSICSMSFKKEKYLITHNFMHEKDKRYLCEYCGISFSSAQGSTLIVHRRTHTGEKPYHCKQCPKTFRTMHELHKHNQAHANLRTYKCTFCHKGFNGKSTLTVHQRIHTGERPYKCEYCPRAFIDNWKRKTHLISVHKVAKENIECRSRGKKSKYIIAEEKKEEENAKT